MFYGLGINTFDLTPSEGCHGGLFYRTNQTSPECLHLNVSGNSITIGVRRKLGLISVVQHPVNTRGRICQELKKGIEH
jgi:hypothetical protein